MRSKTYIIAWDGAIDNCLNISKQLTYKNIEHKFYNVSSHPEIDNNWERRPDVKYYRHFFTAIEDFLKTNYEVFIFNAGDPKYYDWANYTKYVEQIFEENSNLVAFAPNATNDDWSGARSNIANSTKYTNFYLSTCVNGIYFAVSREMCQILYDFYKSVYLDDYILKIDKMYSGWGIDLLISVYAIYNNKYCYRDRGVKLNHPESSNYSKTIAAQEAKSLLDAFFNYLTSNLNYDPDRINKILFQIKQLFDQPKSLGIKDFYSNQQEVVNA